MSEREPVFNVPGVVAAVIGIMVGLHLVRLGLSEESDGWLIGALAFIPGRTAGLVTDWPGGAPAGYTSFFSHAFLHGNAIHLIFNSAWLLAFGGVVAQRIGTIRFLAFFAFTTLSGALAFMVANPALLVPVIGASGAVSGMMGATMRFFFNVVEGGGFRRYREDPLGFAVMPLKQALTDRRVLLATAIWLLLNALAVLGLGGGHAGGEIAWEAHVGGYLAGLLGFGFFDVRLRDEPPAKPLVH